MRNIKIDDLQPSGIELFSDSESYLRELSEGELDINGGGITAAVFSTKICTIVAVGVIVTGAITAAANGKNKP